MESINLKPKALEGRSRIRLLPLLLSFEETLPPLTAVFGVVNGETSVSLSMGPDTVQSVVIVGDEAHSPQPLLRTMLASLSLTNTPKVMRLALVNLGTSVRCCAQLPHLWNGRAASPQRATKLLDLVLLEIQRRALFQRPHPALIVAIDELLDCNLATVGKVLECGPSVGIYVVAATTSPARAQTLDFGVTIDVTNQVEAHSAVTFEMAWISSAHVQQIAGILRTGAQEGEQHASVSTETDRFDRCAQEGEPLAVN